jgi:hypothetical protein
MWALSIYLQGRQKGGTFPRCSVVLRVRCVDESKSAFADPVLRWEATRPMGVRTRDVLGDGYVVHLLRVAILARASHGECVSCTHSCSTSSRYVFGPSTSRWKGSSTRPCRDCRLRVCCYVRIKKHGASVARFANIIEPVHLDCL